MPDDGRRASSGFDLVVMVSGSRYHGVRRSGRGLADALTRHIDVLFVDPPVSPITKRGDGPLRRDDRPGRIIEEGPRLTRLTPLAPPGKDRPMVRGITKRAVSGQVRKAISDLGASRCLLIQQTAHRSILGSIGEAMSVYHSTDDLSAGSDLLGLGAQGLGEAQRRAAHTADATLAVSEVLAKRWRDEGVEAIYLPNGVDVETFAAEASPAPGVELDPPIAAVVGTLSERIDVDLLEEVADRMSLLLVGPTSFRVDRGPFDGLLHKRGVQWVGPQPFEELPSWYRHVDVGLVPYTTSDFNRASFPLKPLEYLAAGKPVVSTQLDSIVSMGAPGITFASTAEDFAAEAYQRAVAGLDEATRSDVADFVADQSWQHRAEFLLDVVAGVRPA